MTDDGRQHPKMNVYEIDPTTDERWEGLLQSHPRASIFHTRGWLEALQNRTATLQSPLQPLRRDVR